jgi:hypothetical protein
MKILKFVGTFSGLVFIIWGCISLVFKSPFSVLSADSGPTTFWEFLWLTSDMYYIVFVIAGLILVLTTTILLNRFKYEW